MYLGKIVRTYKQGSSIPITVVVNRMMPLSLVVHIDSAFCS